ncbi:cation:proton antiporter [Acidithiobacillus sp.]|jgi:Kef-type K+ transport system membrane component KefB|uniref:cation:proton antiporter n=1 Tax=Acidithiobacillus sp. TaxID=1872118 RepID=UPI00260FF5AD|nr:cation:proton antiporter [Acidithiobacillus sp.]
MTIGKHVADLATQQSERLVFFTLAQLCIIILAARLAGSFAARIAQATVVGEIIAGILLGPSLFGWIMPVPFHWVFHSIPSGPLDVLSQLGLILLMFQVGLEFDFSHLKEKANRRVVLWIAMASLLLPFATGFGVGFMSAPLLSPEANRWVSALFVATAFSITAVPVLGRIMMELGITKSRLGVIAISAAAINDVVGWLLLALVTALALAQFQFPLFLAKVFFVLLFVLAWFYFVRPLMKWAIRHFHAEHEISATFLGIVLVGILISGMITSALGIFTIFGGFIMGVILYDEVAFSRLWQERVAPFVLVFFLPIFFTYTGLRTNIAALDGLGLWIWCGLILILATISKFAGVYVAARISGLNHHQGKIIGVMMNTRALMELIVINVGYDMGAISENVFTMLVIMAIVSTVVTTPLLRRWLPHVHGQHGEAVAT